MSSTVADPFAVKTIEFGVNAPAAFTLSVLRGSTAGLGSISLKGTGGHLALPSFSLTRKHWLQ